MSQFENLMMVQNVGAFGRFENYQIPEIIQLSNYTLMDLGSTAMPGLMVLATETVFM